MKKYIDPIHHKRPTNFYEEISKSEQDNITRMHLGSDKAWNFGMCLLALVLFGFVVYQVVRFF